MLQTYTIVWTHADGRQNVSLTTWSDDETAISDCALAFRGDLASIALGRGTEANGVQWLGAWDLCAGKPVWTPAE